MNARTLLILLVVLGIAGWWFSQRRTDPPYATAAINAPAHTPACALPPRVVRGEPPLQSDAAIADVRLPTATLKPRAGFSISARVLGRKDYRSGREADFSPIDLALGWGRMSEDAVLAQLDIRQSSRWYRYRWSGNPPIPQAEIVRSSANMHMIPANADVADALDRIERDDRVRIDGWLVDVQADDGWRWRSSTSREDSGGGACEVVYVCSVARE